MSAEHGEVTLLLKAISEEVLALHQALTNLFYLKKCDYPSRISFRPAVDKLSGHSQVTLVTWISYADPDA